MTKDVILVVDDEPAVRRQVVRHVKSRCVGYSVVEASDGVEALDLLSPRVALIISDVNMPRLSGFELCRGLREAPAESGYAELPIILLTGLDTEADVSTSWEVGSTVHIAKPFTAEKLDAALREVLQDL